MFVNFSFCAEDDISKYNIVYHYDTRMKEHPNININIVRGEFYANSYYKIYRVMGFKIDDENYRVNQNDIKLTVTPYYYNGKLCVDEKKKEIHIFVTTE